MVNKKITKSIDPQNTLFSDSGYLFEGELDLSAIESRNNLKSLFREIRDYFAGNVTGITRDETIAQNIMRLLFCKISEEVNAKKPLTLRDVVNSKKGEENRIIKEIFKLVKEDFPGVFEINEEVELQGRDLVWIVEKLLELELLAADRDVVGDAFEELIGTSFRGGEGQFFTPRNVVEMMIEVIAPAENERIIDPACGTGGFLAHASRYLSRNGFSNYEVIGIDKDLFLAKIARIYLSLLDPGRNSVFCENSLENPSRWDSTTQVKANYEKFDVVLTNPPFGAKIPVTGSTLLSQYELATRWDQIDTKWEKTSEKYDRQPPQILFIERCIQLLKPGGRMGIVLPEGIFGNPSDRYIWDFVESVGNIDGVVSLAQETFQPSTHTKTSVLFFTKEKTRKDKKMFMAIANEIGHNKNGKLVYVKDKNGKTLLDGNGAPLLRDDLPKITERLKLLRSSAKNLKNMDHFGYLINKDEVHDNIYIPEYYNPEIDSEISEMQSNGEFEVLTVGELKKRKILSISRGKEIGSNHYGTGKIPFIRTSDIVNWEVKNDPIKGVSEEVFSQFKKVMDIKEHDILFVNDGTFLIGRTAMVTRLDLKILIQSHVRKIRINSSGELDPFYLLYLLNTGVVQRQIHAKTFVQATISTIGNRLEEVKLPIHKSKVEQKRISKEVQSIIEEKANLRERTNNLLGESL